MKVVKLKKSSTKRIRPASCDEDSDDANYQLNVLPKGMRPSHMQTPRHQAQHQQQQRRLTHHQSLTFIADLAQTSTPTRASVEPITSTPKQLSHDPLKYHPTQTIRSKKSTAPAHQFVVTSSTRRSCCPPPSAAVASVKSGFKREHPAKCMQCIRSGGRVDKRKRTESISIVGHGSNEWDCNLCNLSRAVSSIGETAASAMVMCGNVAITSSTKKKSSNSNNNSASRGIKYVKMSNVEISLQDLLYAPAAAVKSTKFDLVTTSRPRVVRKQQSKIYYL